jgi:hypothetical protein
MFRLFAVLGLLTVCVGCAGLPGGLGKLRCASTTRPDCALLAMQDDPVREPGRGGVGTYLKDRLNDFIDIFSLSLSVGMGADVNVRVTQAIQAGALFWGGARFGFIGRMAGGWSETVFEMGIPGFYVRSVQILAEEGTGIRRMDTERGQSLWQFLGDEGVPYDTGYDRKFWQVGATVHTILIGADFSVNLKELLDFLLGWATVDICRDDTANRVEETEEPDIITIPPDR